MNKLLLIILITTLGSSTLSAQTIDLTLLEQNFAGDSHPNNITKGVTKIYFSARTNSTGRELYVYNPVTDKNTLVKDIYPGQIGSIDDNYSEFAIINDQLYFKANDDDEGFFSDQLWTSDGTSAGTYMVKDIGNNGQATIGEMIVLNNVILFTANDGVNGQELWISNGTNDGTVLLKDIHAGSNGSYPSSFYLFDNQVYFIASDGNNGLELWKTDGTSSGTQIVMDINSGAASSFGYSGFHALTFQNNFYFFANNGSIGYELWKSDGTDLGTQLVKDINIGSTNSSLIITGSTAEDYFVFEASTSTYGREIWKSDGTSEGTVLLKDINPSGNGLYGLQSAVLNNKIYFVADDSTHGYELWVTDGTTVGTQIVKDIRPGSFGSSVYKLTATTNYIVFAAYDEYSGYSTLWKTDGTSDGTIMLKDLNLNHISGIELSFTVLDDLVYFQAGLESASGTELYKTDGTTINTTVVDDIVHHYPAFYGNPDFIAFNDKIIFAGSNGNGNNPFITDGTVNGTKIIKELNPGYSSIYNDYEYRPSFTKAGNNVFFRATNGVDGYEIFKTDGTEIGTFMLNDIAPGATSSIGEYTFFMSLEDIVFFKANDQIQGEELWRSDGTLEGTYLLKDINAGLEDGILSTNLYNNHPYISNESGYAILNGYLYFSAYDGNQYGIWRTDGTTNGTVNVISLDILPTLLNTANGKFFFKGGTVNPNNFISLFSSDGTQEGTTLLNTYPPHSEVLKKNIVHNDEFYITSYSQYGPSLIKSDGTVGGTFTLTNDNFTDYYAFNSLKSCGNNVYFTTGMDGTGAGKQLWRTNGTLTNTVLIEDIPFGTPLNFLNCVCIQDNLFFFKDFFENKIWYINESLTTPNYFQLNNPNLDESDYFLLSSFTNLNNNLLITAGTEQSGLELYYSEIENLLDTMDFNQKHNTSNKINIYPNPSNGKVNLQVFDNSKITAIDVYDLLGKKVHSATLENLFSSQIDLGHFENGIYFLKVKTENYSETEKVIIE